MRRSRNNEKRSKGSRGGVVESGAFKRVQEAMD